VSQKNSQIWQAGVSTSTDKFLINFSKQHQQTFKYDTRIQLSLFLHFYLLYLLLNSCDKMMRHRRLAAALTDTWTTISHHRRIKDLKLTATDYQSNLKSKKQKKQKILLSTNSMKLAVRLSSGNSIDLNHRLQSSSCSNSYLQ